LNAPKALEVTNMNKQFSDKTNRMFALLLLTTAAIFFAIAPAQAGSIAGNTPGFIRKATDLGAVDPNGVITVTVWLQLQNESQLDSLVQQQQHPGSGQYRQWITQDQFNASFGPTSQELNSVQNFLNAKNLSTVFVAENNMFVKVQGTVADVQKAFQVQIHN